MLITRIGRIGFPPVNVRQRTRGLVSHGTTHVANERIYPLARCVFGQFVVGVVPGRGGSEPLKSLRCPTHDGSGWAEDRTKQSRDVVIWAMKVRIFCIVDTAWKACTHLLHYTGDEHGLDLVAESGCKLYDEMVRHYFASPSSTFHDDNDDISQRCAGRMVLTILDSGNRN
jgi:hypothetical protein